MTYAEPIKKNVINGLEVSILPKNYVIPFSAELIGARVYLQKPAKCFRNLIDNQANGTFIIMGETEIICISNKKNDIYDETLTIYPDGIFSVSATIKDGILLFNLMISRSQELFNEAYNYTFSGGFLE